MKYQITIAAMLLAGISASAQMISSHAMGASTAPAAVASAKAALPPAAMVTPRVTGKPVVRINDTVLTDRDLLREMFALFPYARLHNGFPKKQEAGIRQGAMQMIIFEELVYQEALRRKMTIPAVRLQQDERKFKSQFSSQEEFKAYLRAEMDGSEVKLQQQIKRSLLIEALLKSEVENKSVVTPDQARLFYEKNPKQFEHGEVVSFQSISVLPPANANAETLKDTRKKAEEYLKQAKATKNYQGFGLLAEKVSEDDYRVNMGDHKVAKRADLPAEVIQAVLGMKVGEVSGLIQLGNAFTIIRLNGHVPVGRTKFADVKASLLKKLQQQKTEQLRVAFDKRLHQNAKIQEL
ncbi:MAG: peptidylprolyl isomerase [Candidatus Sulfotelmatobacter sp.]